MMERFARSPFRRPPQLRRPNSHLVELKWTVSVQNPLDINRPLMSLSNLCGAVVIAWDQEASDAIKKFIDIGVSAEIKFGITNKVK